MQALTACVNILFIAVFVFVVALQAECPPGWLIWRGSCYILLPEKMTWLGASKACGRQGSSMIVPNTKEEDSFIWQEMKPHMDYFSINSKKDVELWIGCTDKLEIKCLGDAGITGYINWNDYVYRGNDEHCIRMAGKYGGKWGDSNCEDFKFAACEMRVSPRMYWLTAGANGRFEPQCLLNHEIKNLTALGVIGCGHACWAAPQCHSFNFLHQSKICQLKDATYFQADTNDFIFVDGCSHFSL